MTVCDIISILIYNELYIGAFGKDFISWVNILLRDQELSILSGGTSTKYFLLERGACQDDRISTFLNFNLEIFFLL